MLWFVFKACRVTEKGGKPRILYQLLGKRPESVKNDNLNSKIQCTGLLTELWDEWVFMGIPPHISSFPLAFSFQGLVPDPPPHYRSAPLPQCPWRQRGHGGG